METFLIAFIARRLNCPHSLGTLIEWKLRKFGDVGGYGYGPHSLGTLIEWKHFFINIKNSNSLVFVPTRWGH